MSRRRPRRCIYCGYHSNGRACPCHRDLLRVDPLELLAVELERSAREGEAMHPRERALV